ncbi:MAG: hypothetical protein A2Y10_09545 [Planctomycetes bacterium GWF2_41_51]|nr:MAG: hypothetical protein A2Y10_09545 [Planctomycetes bacterium GWF2_41_51]
MTDAQIFQLAGIIYLTVGIGIITGRDFYSKMVASFMDDAAAYYLGGLTALTIGYLLVTFHNDWVKDWPVLITILGWIALIKGIFLLAAPKAATQVSRYFIRNVKFLNIWAAVAIIIGVLFCWLGFFYLRRPIGSF